MFKNSSSQINKIIGVQRQTRKKKYFYLSSLYVLLVDKFLVSYNLTLFSNIKKITTLNKKTFKTILCTYKILQNIKLTNRKLKNKNKPFTQS